MAQTEVILKKYLEQVAKEQNFVKYDIKIEPNAGASFTAALYSATITEGNHVLNLFAKVATIGEAMRKDIVNLYEIEGLAYTKIIKTFDRLQDEHKVPQEHRLAFSKFYGYNPTIYEETLVLEDLVNNGYQAYNKNQSIDWHHAKFALKELAKMHALSFAYGEYYSDEFNEIIQDLKVKWAVGNDQLQNYYLGAIRTSIENIQEKNRDKVQRFFDGIKGDIANILYNKWGRRPVLGHGDFGPSNLLHKIREDGTVDIKIVDLQTIQGNFPVIDLLYFIFTGSDEEFRKNYYQKSLDHYYTELSAAMKRLHLDSDKIYSREDFDRDLNEKLPYGLIMVAITLPIATVDTEAAPQVKDDSDLSVFFVNSTSDLFKERINGVVNDYVRWGILN